MNFPHKQLNGIFRYLFSKDKKYYENYLNVSFTGESSEYHLKNVFDFDSDSYWFSETRPEMFLSFCFKTGFAYVSGYEIKTSSNDAKASKWAFSGSNNNETWEEKTVVSYSMSNEEVHYVQWKKGPFRCYKIDMLGSIDNISKQFDFKQIELFGVFYPENYRYCTRGRRDSSVSSYLFMILLLLS